MERLTTRQSAGAVCQDEVGRDGHPLEPKTAHHGDDGLVATPQAIDEMSGLATVSGLAWPGVNYFCTTRRGGGSGYAWASLNLGLHTGDDSDQVAFNRQTLCARLPGEPVWLRQVHGSDVFDADAGVVLVGRGDERNTCAPLAQPGPGEASDARLAGSELPVADAAITLQPEKVLAIMTADCLPVVMASADGTALGVAHAGWRGLALGVLENTLHSLRRRRPDVKAWRAWVGPGIGQAHFEVGDEVYQAFVEHDAASALYFVSKEGEGKWLADLPSLARHKLARAGVNHIELSGECTYARPDLYFSYRRDGVTGRLATVAWLTQRRVDEGLSPEGSDLP